jgi:enoyl-CoA hydratase/carnithine racemase
LHYPAEIREIGGSRRLAGPLGGPPLLLFAVATKRRLEEEHDSRWQPGSMLMNASTTTHFFGILVQSQGPILRITLNRPEKRNALSRDMLEQLRVALHGAESDHGCRVVVLAANGPVFCAGHDLTEMIGCSELDYRDLFSACSHVMQQLRRLPQPVIARVHGFATAAGCQLAAACDLVVASEQAQFATPGVKIGLFCTTPMVPLVRAIPAKPALEMLLLGTPITAQRAYELGLVNQVATADRLDAVIAEYCDAILASSPLTIRLGKAAFYEHANLDESSAYAQATDVMTSNALSQDAQEGMSAFLQKRRPTWSGC